MVTLQGKCILVCFVMSLASEISGRSLKYSELKDVRMKPGDLIQCKTFSWPFVHWLLVTYNGNLVDVENLPDEEDKVLVIEEHYSIKHNRFDGCINRGNSPAGTNAILNARQMKGGKLFYETWTCNCEHYVKYWSGGNYDETGLGFPASESCGIFKYPRYTSPTVEEDDAE